MILPKRQLVGGQLGASTIIKSLTFRLICSLNQNLIFIQVKYMSYTSIIFLGFEKNLLKTFASTHFRFSFKNFRWMVIKPSQPDFSHCTSKLGLHPLKSTERSFDNSRGGWESTKNEECTSVLLQGRKYSHPPKVQVHQCPLICLLLNPFSKDYTTNPIKQRYLPIHKTLWKTLYFF